MKKLLLIAGALCISAGVFAQKRMVKFSVDMTNQTVSTNGVHVAGNFQGWDPAGTALTKEGSTNIYSTYAQCDVNSVVEFKYINNNSWSSGIESVPAISQKGHVNNGESNDNRWFWSGTGSDTLVLPAFTFGGSAPSGQHAVRFAVDLAKESAVSTDGVHIAGSLQGWDPSKTAMTNLYGTNKIHEVILCLADGSYEFKYVNGNSWGKDESVPDPCKVNGNRGVTVSGSDIALSKVCFGSCDACPTRTLPVYKITFQVDMTNACNWDSVGIAGGKVNGWSYTTMTPGASNVWTYQMSFDSGTQVEYKYRKAKNGAGSPSWEGVDNRKTTVVKDSILPVVCYDANTACTPVPAASDVTFTVDMSNEIVATAGVWVMGNFQDPNWQAGAIKLTQDATNTNWYATTVKNVCPGFFAYKFNNGDPNTAGTEETYPDTTQRACLIANGQGGFNRAYTRTSSSAVVLAYVFNTCVDPTNDVNRNFIGNTEVTLMPNPAEGVFTVSLAGSKIKNITVTNISGKTIREISSNRSSEKVEMTGMSGVYFVNIVDSMGRTSTQKVVLK